MRVLIDDPLAPVTVSSRFSLSIIPNLQQGLPGDFTTTAESG